jgi:hypothetical protein
MLYNSPMLMWLTVSFIALVFVLNSFSVLVTFMMSSVWHAILDNFRPISIWVVQLIMCAAPPNLPAVSHLRISGSCRRYYTISHGEYGEAWTAGSWLQLMGMGVLLVGTAVYNGSIKLPMLEREARVPPAPPSATAHQVPAAACPPPPLAPPSSDSHPSPAGALAAHRGLAYVHARARALAAHHDEPAGRLAARGPERAQNLAVPQARAAGRRRGRPDELRWRVQPDGQAGPLGRAE